jgi:hypothetical protein
MVFLAAASAAATYKIGLNRFDFVPGIVLVAIGEIVAVAMFHDSIARILEILVVGHGLALAGTLVGTSKLLDARPAIAIREEVA